MFQMQVLPALSINEWAVSVLWVLSLSQQWEMAFFEIYMNEDGASEIYPIQHLRMPLRTADYSSWEEKCSDVFLCHMETLDPVTP